MLSLLQLQSKDTIAKLRGVDLGITEVEEKIEAGMRYLPQTSSTEKAKAPVNKVGQKNAKGGGGRGRGGRGRGRGGDEAQAADQQQQGGEEAPKTQAPATEAPAAEAKPAEGESKSAE